MIHAAHDDQPWPTMPRCSSRSNRCPLGQGGGRQFRDKIGRRTGCAEIPAQKIAPLCLLSYGLRRWNLVSQVSEPVGAPKFVEAQAVPFQQNVPGRVPWNDAAHFTRDGHPLLVFCVCNRTLLLLATRQHPYFLGK